MDRYNPPYFDKQEQELIEALDTKEFPESDEENIARLKHAARQFMNERSTKMNIRIDRDELESIKNRAEKEGLKYQSFVKSVLHKYITGQLVEK